MVRCYWCISILIIISAIRCCSLTGPLCGWSAVGLSDRRYPSFRSFDSTISIDAMRMKSYMDSLFDPTCVPVRVTINKLNFFPNRKMPSFVSVSLRKSKPYISVVFFCPVLHRSPCFSDVYFAALTWNFIDDTVLFSWLKGVFRSHYSHVNGSMAFLLLQFNPLKDSDNIHGNSHSFKSCTSSPSLPSAAKEVITQIPRGRLLISYL